MFCPACSAPNEDGAAFCGNCGVALTADATPPAGEVAMQSDTPEEVALQVAPASPPSPPEPPVRPYRAAGSSVETNGMAVASLILGIGGLTVMPTIGSVLALILGYMARHDIRQRPTETSGEGLATAGVVLGWIGVVLTILVVCAGIGLIGLCAIVSSGSAPTITPIP
jgi:hypothetical protein